MYVNEELRLRSSLSVAFHRSDTFHVPCALCLAVFSLLRAALLRVKTERKVMDVGHCRWSQPASATRCLHRRYAKTIIIICWIGMLRTAWHSESIFQVQAFQYDRGYSWDSSARERFYRRAPPAESDRQLQPYTIARISETLGALNTVGKYLVNMTRGGGGGGGGVDGNSGGVASIVSSGLPQEVPGAIYTISKNVFGRNVTDFIREALPAIAPTVPSPSTSTSSANYNNTHLGQDPQAKHCLTPDGLLGICNDLGSCPQLLLNLNNLRQSLCFKNLFTPGVCCPVSEAQTGALVSTTPTAIHAAAAVTVAYQQQAQTAVAPSAAAAPSSLTVDPLDCGQPEEANSRVVGGQEAAPGSWPWLAAIFLRGTRRTEFWCGGSLITARHVLTAAHCTKDSRQRSYAARQFLVRLGDVDLRRSDEPSTPMTYRVDEIIAHPEFSRVGFYNDVALLKLDLPVRKTKYIIPLCLPKVGTLDSEEQLAGRSATVVGWGTTAYGGTESSVQQQARLPVWRNEDCNRAYFQPITGDFVCAGYAAGGTDACQGDSGGPLMLPWDGRWTQIGIVSFGNKCGEPGYPGVYTRITSYLDWIRDNTLDSST